MDLERMRAYVEGTLEGSERAEFEARIADDAGLRRLVEVYGLAVRATACTPPARETTFDDLRLDAPRRSFRWLAAAALLLAAAGVALWFPRAPAEPPPPTEVRLAAIPLDALEAPDVPAWPAALAEHETAGAEGLVWFEDADEAKAIAECAGRPLLAFIHHRQCPICLQYEAGPFRDPVVARCAADFVLLKVDVERMPAWVAREMPRGWPVLAVFHPRGRRLGAAVGYKEAAELGAWLARVSGELRRDGRFGFPDWKRLREEARKLARAETAEPAERLRLWREVEKAGGPLWPVARASRLGMEAAAWGALVEARESAAPAAVLAAAAGELHGTPYAADLRRVQQHVERYGVFPALR